MIEPRTAPRLMTSLRAALAPPGASLLPVLMLPALVGSVWLWVSAEDRTQPAGVAVIFAAVALAWYMLGGALTLAQFRTGTAARRLLAGHLPALTALEGEVWATDRSGLVLWQNDAARRTHGDRLGGPITAALARLSADPLAMAEGLTCRAGLGGEAATSLPGGILLLEGLSGGTLRIWHHRPAQPLSDAAGPAPVNAVDGVVAGLDADGARLPTGSEGDLFQRMPAALLRINMGGRIVAANAAAIALMGGVPEHATLSTMLDGLGRPVDDWVDDVLHGRTEARPEVLHRRGQGTEKHLQVALSPDGDGGVLAMLSDASAMRTLEAQFVQSQKMQAIGQLAGGIAHDFNNLLTAISGHCDLLMLRHDAASPDYADLDQISQNANRAAALVGQLLAFSRKQTLKPRMIDLRDTLSDLTHLMNRLVGERVTLTLEHDADLNPIRADRRQFEQVIMNLVVNARDAMPHGGQITIRTANSQRGRSHARVRPQLPHGDYVTVTVEDEGCGIPPDKLDKIFEPFFTTKRTGEGTGLGLSTVYGIVKQTGGYVFCDSALGRGTTFTLYFPAHDPADLLAANAAEVEATRPAPVSTRLTQPGLVLLVEDEAAVRSFAARALRMRGFEVLEADSAEAALSLLSESRREIDVFVTDVVMPGMDGPSWVRSALRDRPSTRVVFISGYTEDIFDDGRAPIPNSVFVQKPFTLVELSEAVTAQFQTAPRASPEVAPQGCIARA